MKESGEDYIETIYLLGKKQQDVHAVDIARELGFSKPSVTRAVNVLKGIGYVTVDGLNHITLTPQGHKKAEELYAKHQALTRFLIVIGVSAENASKDACRIEHVICEETCNCIKNFIKNH